LLDQNAPSGQSGAMTNQKNPKDTRTERLEAALKANLKRRKAQTRARRVNMAPEQGLEKASSTPASGLNKPQKPDE